MYEITIDLIRDWNDTVKEIFRGSGYPLPENISDEEIGIAYFMQTAQSEEEAAQLSAENRVRLSSLQQTIADNLESVIAPDIRSRTGYEGTQFSFKWVYNNGEHIVEERSSYRIPL
ncbi:hypothetical protein [Paenibacillus sp. NEAU-GSW1]|uniref:hypothetical protein n=1 Tax=Paenibacillus sp. NEAU-GSW1 TaxID=2682486 RepID=UPI0012E2C5A7|nr:hypothetical protein [Paenibacillus sp. NEAU-GSW1]MUT67529.1 hypothetical protein [Paenibacillus sp. NEAU-GSW1]